MNDSTPLQPTPSPGSPDDSAALVLVIDANVDAAARVAGAFVITPRIRPLTVTTVRDLFGVLTTAGEPVSGVVIDMQAARDLARQLAVQLGSRPALAARLHRGGFRAETSPLAQVVQLLRTAAREDVSDGADATPLLIVFTSRHADESAAAVRAGADLWLSASAAVTEALAAWFDLKLRRERREPADWMERLRGSEPVAALDSVPAAALPMVPVAEFSASTMSPTVAPTVAATPFAPPHDTATLPEWSPVSAPRSTESFTVPDLMTRGPSGRHDARVIADLLGVPLKTLAESLGLSYEPLKKVPDREAVQAALAPAAAVIAMVWAALGGDDHTESRRLLRAWMRTPRAGLGRATPLEGMIVRRAVGEVRAWVEGEWMRAG